MHPEGSLPFSQDPDFCSNPEPDQHNQHSPKYF